jgi:flagellar motor protein MotB
MTLPYIRAISFCLFAFILSPLSAQDSETDEAGEFFIHGNYGSALPLIEEQLKKQPESGLLNYRAGVCYLHSRSLKHRAAEYFEKAVEHSPWLRTKALPGAGEAPGDVYRMLGDAYYYAYKFDAAVQAYQKHKALLSEKGGDKSEIAQVDVKTEMCRHLRHYRPSHSLPLSAKTGSPCSDLVEGTMTSSLSPDKSTIIYTLKVPANKMQRQDESSRYFEDPLPATDDTALREKSSPELPKSVLDRDTIVYATTIGTSHDGQVVLTYKNDDGDGGVYISRLRDNRWSKPVKMKKCANPAGWEPNESLSADGTTLYFASDRPGGYGGLDIYRCRLQPDGQWSKAVNLGPSINTVNDETAPFMHSDGVTLFFSSNRLRPGSFDIYSSTASTASSWEKPLNVGYPINSHEKDIFQVAADNKKIYGSKSGAPLPRKDSAAKSQDDKRSAIQLMAERDNYIITFTGVSKTPLHLRRGTVTDESGKQPGTANISVYDNNSGELLGKYHTTDRNGAFSFILPAGRNLHLLYESPGHLPVSESIDLKKDATFFEEVKAVTLKPLARGSTATLSNVFFETDKTECAPQSKLELTRIADLMKEHPDMEIKLGNTIYSSDLGKFYKGLSKARASAVAAWLEKNGIDKKRISAEGTRKKLKVKEAEEKNAKKKKSRSSDPDKPLPPVQELTFTITELKEQKK